MIDAIRTLADVPRNRAPLAIVGSVPYEASPHHADGTALPPGYVPSTLGSFLRAFTHDHALQLHCVHRRFLAAPAPHTPLLPDCGEAAFIDVDSTHKRVYGRTKQGAEYGRSKGMRTVHPLLATVCTPASRRMSRADHSRPAGAAPGPEPAGVRGPAPTRHPTRQAGSTRPMSTSSRCTDRSPRRAWPPRPAAQCAWCRDRSVDRGAGPTPRPGRTGQR
jgi:hypothetical protein